MSLSFQAVKIILHVLTRKKRRDFILACQNPESTQELLKKKILAQSFMPFPDKTTNYLDYSDKNLTQEKVIFFETTSGSTGNKKKIPYTKSLLSSFQNMFLLWANDVIFHSDLNLQRGKFFMSVSPQIGDENKDDRKYLSWPISLLLAPFLISNPNTHKAESSEAFFQKVSQDLIKSRGLEVISIWSPTYLLSFIEYIDKNRSKLNLPPHLSWSDIWPNLKLISCWTHGQASKSFKTLQQYFPSVYIQSKGLLLTEAPVTIPWTEAGGAIPLITETYIEFLDDNENLLSISQIKVGQEYTVVTSQMNGYLRYNTQDLVRVTGFYFKTPVLEFIGRVGNYSDLAGEKLSEIILKEIFSDAPTDFFLVPDDRRDLPGYLIFCEANDKNYAWEKKLLHNHHYQLASSLKQLRPLVVKEVSNLSHLIQMFYQDEGMVLGDIKERTLITKTDQARKFIEWIATKSQSSQ